MRRRHKAGFALASAVLHACGHQPVAIRTTGPSTSSPATTEATTTIEAPATTAVPTSTPAPEVEAPASPLTTSGAGATATPPTVRRTTTTEATADEPTPAGREELLACIRSYEQNDNPAKGPTGYATDTGNGYYGAYQFTWGTWASVGGSGNPAHASAAEQDARAWALYESRGLQPWPTPAVRCA